MSTCLATTARVGVAPRRGARPLRRVRSLTVRAAEEKNTDDKSIPTSLPPDVKTIPARDVDRNEYTGDWRTGKVWRPPRDANLPKFKVDLGKGTVTIDDLLSASPEELAAAAAASLGTLTLDNRDDTAVRQSQSEDGLHRYRPKSEFATAASSTSAARHSLLGTSLPPQAKPQTHIPQIRDVTPISTSSQAGNYPSVRSTKTAVPEMRANLSTPPPQTPSAPPMPMPMPMPVAAHCRLFQCLCLCVCLFLCLLLPVANQAYAYDNASAKANAKLN